MVTQVVPTRLHNYACCLLLFCLSPHPLESFSLCELKKSQADEMTKFIGVNTLAHFRESGMGNKHLVPGKLLTP
jgi:hypothetical protein